MRTAIHLLVIKYVLKQGGICSSCNVKHPYLTSD